MTVKSNLAHIQEMHERQLVTRDSIINWYYFYANKLPKMKPERSNADLVRTIALWMELTDSGGAPGFPFDYKTDIKIPDSSINRINVDPYFILNQLLMVTGIVTIFIRWKWGLGIIGFSILSFIVNYQLRGGPKNFDSVRLTNEGQRAIEWIKSNNKN